MWVFAKLVERLLCLADDEGAASGGAGATVEVQAPAGQSARVEATPATNSATSTPTRNEAGQFTQQQQQEGGQPSGQPAGQESGAAATVQVTTTPVQAGLNAEQLATLRASLVEANPNAVHELIQGATFEEMIASVPAAREAQQRVADRVQEAAAATVTRGGGTAGGGPDVESLSGEAKIGVGLQQRRTR